MTIAGEGFSEISRANEKVRVSWKRDAENESREWIVLFQGNRIDMYQYQPPIFTETGTVRVELYKLAESIDFDDALSGTWQSRYLTMLGCIRCGDKFVPRKTWQSVTTTVNRYDF